MALKVLLIKKRLDAKRKALADLRAKAEGFKAREEELTRAIDEATEEQTAEVEELVNAFDAERSENDQAIADLEREVEGIEAELAAEEEAQATEPPANTDPQTPAENEERSNNTMNHRDQIPEITLRDRVAAIVTREDVKGFLDNVRSLGGQQRAIANVGLLKPSCR